MTCKIGILTPPIGENLFVAVRIANLSIEQISYGMLLLIIHHGLMILD